MLYPIKNKNRFYLLSDIKYPRIRLLLSIVVLLLAACENFVEVDSPKNLLDAEKIYENKATVESALANIYLNLREQGLLSANSGLSALIGSYADELNYLSNDRDIPELQHHTLTASNSRINIWWSHAYTTIYSTDDIVEGLNASTEINNSDKDQLKGQALFIRAFIHSILVNLFGDIPYISTTNYFLNNTVEREPEAEVYSQIITDLEEAISLLSARDIGEERVIPDQTTAKALLARIYLYTENWEQAEKWATEVIQTPGYQLETDITNTFLKESSEAIWQFKPNMVTNRNADEVNSFIVKSLSGQKFVITEKLAESFETGDLRKEKWMGEYHDPDTENVLYYPYKYKADLNITESLEYSIVFRLAEQYLIRAEAQAHLGRVDESQKDLNRIRNRAGLPNTNAHTKKELVEAIIHERQVELFTEYGHRWFDLKRTHQAAEALSPIKPNWIDTNIFFPLPESELELNPNLQPQNEGY